MGDLSSHFSRDEFACKCGCGFDVVDVELISVLESVRDFFKKPVSINSGCRCSRHNRDVGGSVKSKHKLGIACDFVVNDSHADDVANFLEWKYKGKYGIGRYVGRTHIDVKSCGARRWDKRL